MSLCNHFNTLLLLLSWGQVNNRLHESFNTPLQYALTWSLLYTIACELSWLQRKARSGLTPVCPWDQNMGLVVYNLSVNYILTDPFHLGIFYGSICFKFSALSQRTTSSFITVCWLAFSGLWPFVYFLCKAARKLDLLITNLYTSTVFFSIFLCFGVCGIAEVVLGHSNFSPHSNIHKVV